MQIWKVESKSVPDVVALESGYFFIAMVGICGYSDFVSVSQVYYFQGES